MDFTINWTEASQAFSIQIWGSPCVSLQKLHWVSGFGARAHLLFVITQLHAPHFSPWLGPTPSFLVAAFWLMLGYKSYLIKPKFESGK